MVWRLLAVTVWLCLGCAGDDLAPADARPIDAGPGDAGPGDTGPGDTGPGDTGGAVDTVTDQALSESAVPDATATAADGTTGDDAVADAPMDLGPPPLGSRKADILFVVDNSGSMAEEQQNLARNFPLFMDQLGTMAELDLHVGVVSTDLGAGATSINTSCLAAPGDDGALCRPRAVDRCAMCGVQGRYLTTKAPNFLGNVRDVFTCVARLGTTGCALEHSLGALHRALTSPDNAGFVRPDALLALVIITDEDDCTAPANSQLFAAVRPGQDTSLRCALEGHLCQGARHDGNSDVDLPLGACQPATDGALVPVQQLVDAVTAVKGDPRSIVATAVFGWPLPGAEAEARYRIGLSAGSLSERTLKPVCASEANGSAVAGLRVKKFVESFPNHSAQSICQNDFREVLVHIAEKIASAAP